MKPYFETELGKLYHGDCREIMLELEAYETIITDPVWPGAKAEMPGRKNPEKLFLEMCNCINDGISRLVVQIGCDTDPRFLRFIPNYLQFLRVCWLEYALPSYKGRLLYTGDIAYVYGIPPKYIKGRQIMLGKCTSTKPDKLFKRPKKTKNRKDFDRTKYDNLLHPSPRRPQHVKWLVYNFSDNDVLDPFAGACTTAVACEQLDRKWICIEIEERFCELSAKRLESETAQLKWC